MGKKFYTSIWNFMCFITLALFAITMFMGLIKTDAAWISTVLNICNILIAVTILISAWNAVAHKSKGWKITYLVFLLIIIVSVVLPFII